MAPKKGLGCAPILVFVVVLITLLVFGANEGAGMYFTHCEAEEDFLDCMMGAFEDEPEPEEGSVTATGDYTHKGYTVTVTMHIPLDGGNVTGSVSGACDGIVKGTYSANGGISGSLSGTCDPFFVKLPASAEFSGTVNKTGKAVPINFTGRCAGYSRQDGMTLVYQ